ncbi:MAG: hypothetical protein R2754_04305 [Microthrixaceae bacterium]
MGWADVATKRDLDQLSERLELMIRTEIAGVRTEIAEVRSSFEKTMRHQLTVLLSAMVSIAGLLIALSIYGPS